MIMRGKRRRKTGGSPICFALLVNPGTENELQQIRENEEEEAEET